MTTSQRVPRASGGRSDAVGDLFAALEGLLITYQALPDGERERRWNDDAELITGAVAMHLSTARGRLNARPRHPVAPGPSPDAEQLPSP